MLKRIKTDTYLYYALAISLAIIALFPIYWTVISSLKIPSELIRATPTFFPENLTFQHYIDVWNFGNQSKDVAIADSFFNTLILTVGTVVVSGVLCTLTGYSLAIYKLPGRQLIFMIIILPILVPGLGLIIPLFQLFKNLGLLDTYIGLILLYSLGQLPLGTFIMRNAFESVPISLREIAVLEGSSEMRILLQIFLPLALPGLITLTVFASWAAWNDYLTAFIFTSKPEMTTLNVALARIVTGANEFETAWGMLMAGSMISFIPIIILYMFLQKYFVRGVAGSAVKE